MEPRPGPRADEADVPRVPVGALLVWETPGNGQAVRGGTITAGPEQLLLDGQQRVTRLYGIVRGRAPSFFKGEFNVATASGAA